MKQAVQVHEWLQSHTSGGLLAASCQEVASSHTSGGLVQPTANKWLQSHTGFNLHSLQHKMPSDFGTALLQLHRGDCKLVVPLINAAIRGHGPGIAPRSAWLLPRPSPNMVN